MIPFLIKFSKICRDCLMRAQFSQLHTILGDEKAYLKYLQYTELELAEEMLVESEKREICCEYCGSMNFQMYDTIVEQPGIQSHKSFDYDRDGANQDNFIFYQVVMKKKDGQYTLKEGGRGRTKKEYKQHIIEFLNKKVRRAPSYSFNSYRIGEVRLVVSGQFVDAQDPEDSEVYLNFKIEQFFHTGFSNVEILDVIHKNYSVFHIDGVS